MSTFPSFLLSSSTHQKQLVVEDAGLLSEYKIQKEQASNEYYVRRF
jgi:hypothetical protein